MRRTFIFLVANSNIFSINCKQIFYNDWAGSNFKLNLKLLQQVFVQYSIWILFNSIYLSIRLKECGCQNNFTFVKLYFQQLLIQLKRRGIIGSRSNWIKCYRWASLINNRIIMQNLLAKAFCVLTSSPIFVFYPFRFANTYAIKSRSFSWRYK